MTITILPLFIFLCTVIKVWGKGQESSLWVDKLTVQSRCNSPIRHKHTIYFIGNDNRMCFCSILIVIFFKVFIYLHSTLTKKRMRVQKWNICLSLFSLYRVQVTEIIIFGCEVTLQWNIFQERDFFMVVCSLKFW